MTVANPVAQIHAVNTVAAHLLIMEIGVGSALESVCTGLGDYIDSTAGKVALTYIVRRNCHLHLLDCINRNRCSAAGQIGRKTETVVQNGAVDCECGSAAVPTRHSVLNAAVG